MEKEILKSEVYVKTLAWLIIIISGMVLYFSIFNIISYFLVSSLFEDFHNQFGAMENEDPETANQIKFVQNLFFWLFIGVFVLSILFFISGLGLRRKKHWARMLYTILAVLIAVFLVLGSVYITYAFKKEMRESQKTVQQSTEPSYQRTYEDGSQKQELENNFRTIVLAQKVQTLSFTLFLFLFAWVFFRSVFKLNGKNIRKVFDNPSIQNTTS